MKLDTPVLWFYELGREDIPLAGGKGANLGEMTKEGIPVPPGFVVTTQAYYYFLDKAQLKGKIDSLLGSLDPHNSAALQSTSEKIMALVMGAPMPREVAEEVRKAYRKMGEPVVAVRSSATAEDLPEASFAGQQSTFLNIQGDVNVLKAVQACWASLFESRAIFYRFEHGFDHFKVGIAVPVQKMVQSESSGVMFTVDPVAVDESKMLIEAVFGLGEAIVSGAVTPDHFLLDKASLEVVEKKVAVQDWKLVRNLDGQDLEGANIRVDLTPEEGGRQKLSEQQIRALASLGKEIEEVYSFPQDIEWAVEDGAFYILQTRPVTTLEKRPEEMVRITAKVLLSGSAASPGIAAGPVRVIHRASEIGKVRQGDVLVTEMTTPDFVPAMKRASAIVTDRGGRTAHAAIVSRELGVPCVVGTDSATKVLKDSQQVTVNGSAGRVYAGIVEIPRAATAARKKRIRTATRVYVNLADPELADRVAARDVDGVGLLRAEFIMAHIGEHPMYMLSQGRGQEFVDKVARDLETFAKAFHPRPVVYRTTDFKTNEYRNLKGGEAYEEVEENPMLGYRGVSRYVREREAFRLETEAIKKVRLEYDNLYVMLPFVRTPAELAQVVGILEEEGLSRSRGMKLWMMVEIPSNVILLEEFLKVGLDGISIGSNDLTQLTLGVDRDSAKLAEVFDELDPAVLWSLERTITTAVRAGVRSSICGQAPSFFPDLTRRLVEWGITSVSVSPDMIDRTREMIGRVEKRLGKLPPQEG